MLDNINFSLENREHLSIIGINGSGKSTLLKCLCNFIDYEGSIHIDNKEIRSFKPKELAKKITILSQNFNMYFDYKVIDVVNFGRYSYNEDFSNEEIIDDILKNMGIYHLKNKYMSSLSGGECQKVFISRVFVQNPDIILLDELNNNLDIKSQIYIVNNIKELFKDKILITVFHDLNLVRHLNQKVMILKDSKIYKYAYVDEVLTKENLKNVYGVDVVDFMISSLKKWEKSN